MKMKRIFFNKPIYHETAMKEKLEKLALKGWKVKKFTHFFLELEKIEPEKLEYAITFFPDCSVLDGVPKGKQVDFIDYCKESGWDYLAQCGQMMVFCSNCDSPTPLETDEELKLETIHKSMKKETLPTIFLNIFLQSFMLFIQVKQEAYSFYSSASVYLAICLTLIIFSFCGQVFQYGQWYFASKKSVEQGGFCTNPLKMKWIDVLAGLSVGGIILMLMDLTLGEVTFWIVPLCLLYIVPCFVVISWLRKQTYETKTKYSIYVVVAMIPVMLVNVGFTMFLISGFDKKEAENNPNVFAVDIAKMLGISEEYRFNDFGSESYFAKRRMYSQSPVNLESDSPSLYYTIYESKFPWILEQILEEIIGSPDDFLGEEGYALIFEDSTTKIYAWHEYDGTAGNTKVICSGNTIIFFEPYDDLTEEIQEECVEILLAEMN